MIIYTISVTLAAQGDTEIRVKCVPGLFDILFKGMRTHTRTYLGNCTVWHRYPSGRRAPSWMEGFFCDEEKKEEMKLQAR